MSRFRPDRVTRRIYCDESSQLNHKYFVLGAVWHERDHDDFEETIKQVKAEYCLHSEIKWGKGPRRPGKYFEGYKAVIDKYFQLPVGFKTLIVDTDKYPLAHQKFNLGNAELGLYKFYYQLLYTGLIARNPTRNYVVKLDSRPNPDNAQIVDLERCINASAERDNFPDMWMDLRNYDCCVVEENDSQQVQGIQIADLLTGMVAARWNGRTTNPTKLALIDHFESRLGKSLKTPSVNPTSQTKCNTWIFRSRRG